MEKRIILAFIISLVLITAWQMIFRPEPPAPPPEDRTPSSSSSREAGEAAPPTRGPDASPGPAEPQDPDALGPRRRGEPAADPARPLVLEGGALRLEFTRRGGALVSARLLEHKQEVDSPAEGYEGRFELIRTYEGGPSALTVADFDHEGWLEEATWDTEGASPDGRSIEFTLPVREVTVTHGVEGAGRRVSEYLLVKRVAIDEHPHRIAVELRLLAEDGAPPPPKLLYLTTSGGVFPEQIIGATMAQSHTLLGLMDGSELTLQSMTAKDLLEEEGEKTRALGRAHFACDMGLYFGAYLRWIEGGRLEGVRVRALDPHRGAAEPAAAALALLGPQRTSSAVGVLLGAENEEPVARFDYYLGAKDHRAIREAYAEGSGRDDYLAVADRELTDQGFCCSTLGPLTWVISAISKAVIAALDLFKGWFGSMGLSIIVLTVCVRTLLFPITRKSQVAMHRHSLKMAELKPRLDKIKEKYADDPQTAAQKQMELMRKEKMQLVPVGGCLPMFLQIPVFFGLFSALRFDYDLRHASFLWVDDLALPDRLVAWDPLRVPCCIGPGLSIDGLNVLPILMIGAMFVHQLGMPRSPDPQMQQQQKMMLMMPFFFGLLMYGYAAGLSLYWLSSSLFGIFEQRVIKKIWPIDGGDDAAKPAAS